MGAILDIIAAIVGRIPSRDEARRARALELIKQIKDYFNANKQK